MAFFRSKSLFGVDENTGAANHRYQMPKTRTWREHDGLDFGFSLVLILLQVSVHLPNLDYEFFSLLGCICLIPEDILELRRN